VGLKQKYGQTALVAGASEGIGAAFCHALASEGIDIVMIARRKEPLEKEATNIRTKYGVKVTTIACDLADPDIIKTIESNLGSTAIDILVYNAALSHIGPFLDASIDDNLRITTVNIQTPMRLMHHFGGAMVARGRGAVITMASIAGFQGSGFLTSYATTKAADRVLAESLWYEWKGRGVDVIACCAGATSTPNYINTKPEKSSPFAPRVQTPEEVVKECLLKLGKVPSFVTGSGNKLATFFMKLMPRKMAVNIMGDTTRQMYKIDY
jgi:hypothetical protein